MSTQELALPAGGDANTWTDQERALVEASGLVSRNQLAPRATVEAFLSHCRRTGLDPIARQIYAIERGGKWGIQVSIDGARLVAERSGEYAGQTPVQWTGDGVTWVDVWLSKDDPAAARVGVYRRGFAEPLVAVATFDAYNAGGPMWRKMPALMLAKCAEMLALRKAFPQDLSDLYSSEEMDQAGQGAPARSGGVQEAPMASEPVERAPLRDWLGDVNAAESVDVLRGVWVAARDAGDLNVKLADGCSLDAYIRARSEEIANPVAVEVVEAEVVEGEPVSEWPVAEIPDGGDQS